VPERFFAVCRGVAAVAGFFHLQPYKAGDCRIIVYDQKMQWKCLPGKVL
jgi:hypothetical protein